jgi:hypothetical protein
MSKKRNLGHPAFCPLFATKKAAMTGPSPATRNVNSKAISAVTCLSRTFHYPDQNSIGDFKMGLALIFPPATGSFSFFRNPYGLMLEALLFN